MRRSCVGPRGDGRVLPTLQREECPLRTRANKRVRLKKYIFLIVKSSMLNTRPITTSPAAPGFVVRLRSHPQVALDDVFPPGHHRLPQDAGLPCRRLFLYGFQLRQRVAVAASATDTPSKEHGKTCPAGQFPDLRERYLGCVLNSRGRLAGTF